MATCKSCGKKIGWTQVRGEGVCPDCHKEAQAAQYQDTPGGIERQRQKQERRRVEEQIDAILLTTETFTNMTISQRLEVVTAECAFGMNVFKDLFSGVRDIVGGRSKAVQQTLRDTRRTALHELKREAHLIGGNAVIGVDLDYTELSAGGNMVLLVASGTAVVIEDLAS